MTDNLEKKTARGFYLRDQAGLCHYFMDGLGSTQSAILDALEHVPSRPSWFWFNGTPAPIVEGDDVDSLYKRWSEWRTACQSSADPFLAKLFEWSKSR